MKRSLLAALGLIALAGLIVRLPTRATSGSTLIRQNGCPNYIKFRITLNRIQNRDLSSQTTEDADDEPLKPEDFPFTRIKSKSSTTTVELSLKLRKLQKTLRSA
jgi:hypothetical protein